MTAPVQPKSAPARHAQVGLQLHPKGRWLPMIADRFMPDGTITFRWPSDPATSSRRIGLKLTWPEWQWLPAAQCRFVKSCPDCKGHGTTPEGATVKRCTKCDGTGEVPNRHPFKGTE